MAHTRLICPKIPLTALASNSTAGDEERNSGTMASSDRRPKMTRIALWLNLSQSMPAGMEASADASSDVESRSPRNAVSKPMWSTYRLKTTP